MVRLSRVLTSWVPVVFAVIAIMALVCLAQQDEKDPLKLQAERNRRVAERGKQAFYPADKFDLKNLLAYKPETKAAGTIRIWGNNYLQDGELKKYWEEGFRKFQPNVKIEWNLKTAAIAIDFDVWLELAETFFPILFQLSVLK